MRTGQQCAPAHRHRAPPQCARRRFAEYRKDDPASFMLHQNLSYFPQFMFNLRRSQFVQVRGRAGCAGC